LSVCRAVRTRAARRAARHRECQRVDLQPRVERLLGRLGDRDLALDAALAAHVEAVVARVGARPAQIARLEAAQLSRPQPTITQDAQQRVVRACPQASAGPERAAGSRSRCLSASPAARADAAARASRRSRPHGRAAAPTRATSKRRSAASTPPPARRRVRAEIGDHRRAAELAAEPVAERAVDRGVLAPRRRRRRPRRDPLAAAHKPSKSQAGWFKPRVRAEALATWLAEHGLPEDMRRTLEEFWADVSRAVPVGASDDEERSDDERA